jgi:hypothetical protein
MRALRIYTASTMAMGLLTILSSCKSNGVSEGASDSGDVRTQFTGPLWHPWHPGWGGWAVWDPEPAQALVTHDTGHVLAHLAGPVGKRIRCEFRLIR